MADAAGRWDLREYGALMGMINQIGQITEYGKQKREEEQANALYQSLDLSPERIAKGEFNIPENTPPAIQRKVKSMAYDDFGKKLSADNAWMANQSAKWDQEREVLAPAYNSLFSGDFEANKKNPQWQAQFSEIVNKAPVPYRMKADQNGFNVTHELDVDGKEPQVIPFDQLTEEMVRSRLDPIFDPENFKEMARVKMLTDYRVKNENLENPDVYTDASGKTRYIARDFKNFENSLISESGGMDKTMTVAEARKKGVYSDDFEFVGKARDVEAWNREQLKEARKRAEDYQVGRVPLVNKDGEVLYRWENKDSHGVVSGSYYSADMDGQKQVSAEAAQGYYPEAVLKELNKIDKKSSISAGIKIIDSQMDQAWGSKDGGPALGVDGKTIAPMSPDERMGYEYTAKMLLDSLNNEMSGKASPEKLGLMAGRAVIDAKKRADADFEKQVAANPEFIKVLEGQKKTPEQWKLEKFQENVIANANRINVELTGKEINTDQSFGFDANAAKRTGGNGAQLDEVSKYAQETYKKPTAALGVSQEFGMNQKAGQPQPSGGGGQVNPVNAFVGGRPVGMDSGGVGGQVIQPSQQNSPLNDSLNKQFDPNMTQLQTVIGQLLKTNDLKAIRDQEMKLKNQYVTASDDEIVSMLLRNAQGQAPASQVSTLKFQ